MNSAEASYIFATLIVVAMGLALAMASCAGERTVPDSHIADATGDSGLLADLSRPDLAAQDLPAPDLPGEDLERDTVLDGNSDAGDLLPDLPDAIAHPALYIPSANIPVTPPGAAVAFQLSPQGGVPPYSHYVVASGERAPFEPLGQLPPGVALDADLGTLTGIPTAAGVYYFVVEVADSAGQRARQLFGLRIGDPLEQGPMAARAIAYQEIYELRHLWHGFSYGNWNPDAQDGDYQLSTLGDATFVSGNCTMAMAYRYAVEKSPEALAVVKEQVDGFRFFQRLTGVPGLIGRSFAHESDPSEHGAWDDFSPGSHKYLGTGEFEGWRWRGDVSRDQASGALLGIAAAYDLVDDPEVKTVAATFIAEMADHIWDNGLKFVDPDGKPTKYGDYNGEILEGWPMPNGLNALCALTLFKAAAHASGEERFQDYYDQLIEGKSYMQIMEDFMWVYSGYSTKWYNTYIAWENFFHLMRLEEDPERRSKLEAIFDKTLWNVQKDPTPNHRGIAEWNPVKTAWFLYSTGRHDPESLYRALWMVERFPDAPLRDRKVTNSLDPTIEKNPDKPQFSMYPLPPDKRIPDMVIWHRGPYGLDGGEDSSEERTGCDYLLPYWMGRYYGFIDESW